MKAAVIDACLGNWHNVGDVELAHRAVAAISTPKDQVKILTGMHWKELLHIPFCQHYVIPGGGFFRSGLDKILKRKTAALLLAKLLHKRITVFPQTIGPFTTHADKVLTTLALKNVDLAVREPSSLKEATALKLDSHKQIDAAIDTDTPPKKLVLLDNRLFFSTRLGIQKIAYLVFAQLQQRKDVLIFIVPTIQDPWWTDHFKAFANNKLTFSFLNLHVDVVKNIFASGKLAIVCSLHGAIFALNAKVNTIGLFSCEYYRRKFECLQAYDKELYRLFNAVKTHPGEILAAVNKFLDGA